MCTVAKVVSAYLNNYNDNTHPVLQEITGDLTAESKYLGLLLSNAREEEQLVFMQIR